MKKQFMLVLLLICFVSCMKHFTTPETKGFVVSSITDIDFVLINNHARDTINPNYLFFSFYFVQPAMNYKINTIYFTSDQNTHSGWADQKKDFMMYDSFSNVIHLKAVYTSPFYLGTYIFGFNSITRYWTPIDSNMTTSNVFICNDTSNFGDPNEPGLAVSLYGQPTYFNSPSIDTIYKEGNKFVINFHNNDTLICQFIRFISWGSNPRECTVEDTVYGTFLPGQNSFSVDTIKDISPFSIDIYSKVKFKNHSYYAASSKWWGGRSFALSKSKLSKNTTGFN